MSLYINAEEFRQKFSELVEDLKRTGEIVVLNRSKPLFKVVPLEKVPSDPLNGASAVEYRRQPDLQEIFRIVHRLRQLSSSKEDAGGID